MKRSCRRCDSAADAESTFSATSRPATADPHFASQPHDLLDTLAKVRPRMRQFIHAGGLSVFEPSQDVVEQGIEEFLVVVAVRCVAHRGTRGGRIMPP